MAMDIAESLATADDFVASETETELSVNGCVFPQPKEGAVIPAGSFYFCMKTLIIHVSGCLVVAGDI